jgi:DNA repair photolyase
MNPSQVSRVSLRPEDVDAFVFWTRHARPLFDTLPLLDRDGFRYYFLYTITGYGRPVEARTPPLEIAVDTFVELSQRLPLGSVVWRYDPVLVGPAFPVSEHARRFELIASRLAGYANHVIISLVDLYRKTTRRMGQLYEWDRELSREPERYPELPELLEELVKLARQNGMMMEACAEPDDYADLRIEKAKCIDDRLLRDLFGGEWEGRKDPGQRDHCACVRSRDIGIPDTCTFGCAYCYATRGDELAARRRRMHDPEGEALLPLTIPV